MDLPRIREPRGALRHPPDQQQNLFRVPRRSSRIESRQQRRGVVDGMADDGLVDQVKRRDKNPELMDWIILWAQAISEMERMQEKLIRIQKIHEDAEIAAQLNRLMTDVSIKNLGDRVQRLEDSLSKLKE